MIFCKSRKFIFLRVPKTASTSLSLQIQKNLNFQPGDFSTKFTKIPPIGFEFFNVNHEFKIDEHPTINQPLRLSIITDEELESYSIYGVLREPVERFFSLFCHMIDVHRKTLGLQVENMTKEQIALFAFECLETAKKQKTNHYLYSVKPNGGSFPMRPQSDWLIYNNKPINNIIVYPNFDEFLTKLNGSPEFQFKEKIGKKPIDSGSPVSKSILEGIKYWYAKDFDLWEKLGYNK